MVSVESFQAIERSDDGRTVVHFVAHRGEVCTWQTFLGALRSDRAFRIQFGSFLAELDHNEVFWETPPLSLGSLGSEFMFATTAARLGAPVDESAFAEFFSDGNVATFSNLGGDAVLVSPAPVTDGVDYRYLLSFLRTAAPSQIDSFWLAAATAIWNAVAEKPIWVSTSGGGIAWLHLRIGQQPKYYFYEPFTE